MKSPEPRGKHQANLFLCDLFETKSESARIQPSNTNDSPALSLPKVERQRGDMLKLARTIAKELEIAGHCGVYQRELSRVWPMNGGCRHKAVTQFAQSQHWRLRFYKESFVATFDKVLRTEIKVFVPQTKVCPLP
jgi:hypothetical protein